MIKKTLSISLLLLSFISSYSEARHPVGYRIVKKPTRVCHSRVVESSRDYTGALIGGAAGGLLGHQIGSGRGNTLATIAGAGTGAVIGDQISRRRNQRVVRSCRTVMRRVRVPIY